MTNWRTNPLGNYRITSAATVGACGTAGSFRAIRRSDNLPVLLHRFRPAAEFTDRRILDTVIPDFDSPFITTCTDLFEAAGTAYIVEPLPAAALIIDIWLHLSTDESHLARSFITAAAQQIHNIDGVASPQSLVSCLPFLVLTQSGICGLLSDHVATDAGLLPLRDYTDYNHRVYHRHIVRLADLFLQAMPYIDAETDNMHTSFKGVCSCQMP